MKDALETGNGVHFLWHLEMIDCLEEIDPNAADDEGTMNPALRQPTKFWSNMIGQAAQEDPIRVAIIDNGCSLNHPNLLGRGDERRVRNPIEFAAHIQGTVYGPELTMSGNDRKEERFEGLKEKLDELEITPDTFFSDDITPKLRKVIRAYTGLDSDPITPKHIKELPPPTQRFSAHGTSCAGLVAGHPQDLPSEDTRRDNNVRPNPAALPYFGVNPQAQVIPIATVYSHAYWPLVMGLLYALAQDADVILIPRAVEEMQEPGFYETHRGRGTGEDADPRANGFLTDRQRWADKELFEKLLKIISKKVPVVMAAGNSGSHRLEYPAKLVESTPDLIVVGAATAFGLRATYSSGFLAEDDPETLATVATYAPSDDRQETSDTHFRFFDLAWRTRRINVDAFYGADALQRPYSPYGVFAIDLPGQYGYDADSGDDLDLDEFRINREKTGDITTPESQPRGLYTLFGGTSAACSIVAGIVSLIKADTAGATLSPAQIKSLLRDASAPRKDGVFKQKGDNGPDDTGDTDADAQDSLVPNVISLKTIYEKLRGEEEPATKPDTGETVDK